MHCGDDDHAQYYSEIIETAFRVLASACLGIIAAVALVFPILVNKNFEASYYQIPIYMLSSLLYSVIGIYSVVYIAFKKTGKIARTSMIAAAINLIVNIGLIRYIGLYAASISSVAAYGVLLLARYIDIRKFIKITIKKRVVLSVIGVMILDFIVYYIRNNWLSLINLIIVAVYAVFLNRKILEQAVKMVKEKRKKGDKVC